MADPEVDINDLARRLAHLEDALERISERATRREEDWGTVRSKADKVDALRDEVRELRHMVTRSGGSAPVEAAAAKVPLAALATEQPTKSVVDAVVAQLKGQAIPTSKADIAALVRQTIVDDAALRQTMVTWFIQELQARGISIPPALLKRGSKRPEG